MFSDLWPHRRGICAILILFSCLCACGGGQQQDTRRIAVLPVENLTGDASLDWMGNALAHVISAQLVGLESVHARGAQDRNDATGWRATQVLSGYFTADSEFLDVHLVLRDRARNVTLQTLDSRAATTEIIQMAGNFASEIAGEPRPYGTASLSALHAYSESLATQDPAEVEPGLHRALEADPGYGQAYVALAQLLLSKRDTDGLDALLAQAAEQADKIDRIDQGRLAAFQATAGG